MFPSSEPLPGDNPLPGGAFGPVALYYEHLMAGVPYRFWLSYIEQVWAAHNLTPHRVLDLACGTGAMSRLLARRGYSVTGVDIAPAMIFIAEQKADAEGVDVPFLVQDAAELNIPGPAFDACLCLFDSLNYILKPERLQSAFARVCEHLAPGGAFLFDLNTEYALAEGMFTQSSARKSDPLHYRWRSSYDSATRLCTVKMRFVWHEGEQEQVFHETHVQRAYLKDEVVTGLKAAGFANVTVYDAYSLHPPKKRSDRLFFLAMKSA